MFVDAVSKRQSSQGTAVTAVCCHCSHRPTGSLLCLGLLDFGSSLTLTFGVYNLPSCRIDLMQQISIECQLRAQLCEVLKRNENLSG
ncbi:Protein phosphatase 1 regulatory subunit 3A [Manis javanica]|nr:Protein phosphatase 1 regulatory subunit 3A [Manis javanica]